MRAGPAALIALLLSLAAPAARAQEEVPPSAPRERMTFEIVDMAGICDDCSVVQASGRIAEGTASDFWRFLASHKMKPVVIFAFHSPGGLMEEAMRVGSGLRALNARVVVGRVFRKGGVAEVAPAVCLSACTMSFAGGSRRTVAAGSQFGVHSWIPTSLAEVGGTGEPRKLVLDRAAVRRFHASNASYMEYLDRMGIDLRLLMRAFQVPNESMARLTRQEMKDFKVVTDDVFLKAEAGRTRPVLDLHPPGPLPAQAGRGVSG